MQTSLKNARKVLKVSVMQVKTEISYSILFNFNIGLSAQIFQTGQNLHPEGCEPGESQLLFKTKSDWL